MTSVESRPSVSIVMTAYNSAATIKAAIDAALGQNYPTFEIVVLDDGSTDETEPICRSFTDPRLRYLKRQRIGRPKALNEAILSAQGDYIAINDADDLSHPFRLQHSMTVMNAHPEVAIMGTNYWKTSQCLFSIHKIGILQKTKPYLSQP